MFRCCWLLLGAVRYFFFLFNSLLLSVCCFAFLFNVGLFVNTATQLYQPVVATSYCKMPKNKRAREDTNTHTGARTHTQTHNYNTQTWWYDHNEFYRNTQSFCSFGWFGILFYYFFSTNGCCACVCQFDRELKIPAYFNFFFCSVICFVNKIISCVDRKSIAIP